MKRNIKYIRLVIVLLAFISVVFVSCKDDDDDTSGVVVLEAYGPSPALRGSDISFIGQNMDQVTSVIFPDNIEVTDIEFVTSEKIKATVPQDAVEGYVKLVSSDGEITSKSLLTYTEPISVSKISPVSVKAGQTLTIEGDYLYLISKIIFSDEVAVTYKDFGTWERTKITLEVPIEAQTGVIVLSDTTASPVELESDTVLQVVLPSVSSVVTLENKKPGDEISVTGTDLDLVESVILPNDSVVDFTVDDNKLSFSLPSGTTDGKINMVSYSGISVAIAQITMAVPSELTATPATGLRAGDEITITGTNLDLITTVVFPNVESAVTPSTIETDKIIVVMPDAAISGDLTLNTASGNTTTIAIETQKPEVVSFSSSTVSAGDEVTLTGTNLDLVTAITFSADIAGEISSQSETDITLVVPVDAESGALTLTMANGETVTTASLEIEKPEFCYIPVLPDDETEINAGEILTVDIENGDVLTDVQVNGSSTQYILVESSLYILIPNGASGSTNLSLISSNGDITYQISVIGSGTTETVVFEGATSLSWSDGGRVVVPASAFDEVSAGSVMKIYFTQMDDWGQAQINNGGWATIPFEELGNDGYITTNTYNDASVTEQELVLTQDILDNIKNNAGDFNGTTAGIIIQGQNWIISKITIITTSASETVAFEGSTSLSWSDGGRVTVPVSYFESLSAGDIMKIYFEQMTDWGQAQINNGGWATIPFEELGNDGYITTNTYDDASVTEQELVLTQDILDNIKNNAGDFNGVTAGIIIQGQNWIITKISIIEN